MCTTHRIRIIQQGMFSIVPSAKYFRTSLWKLSILLHPVDFQSLLKLASNFPCFPIFHIGRLSSFLQWLSPGLPTTVEPVTSHILVLPQKKQQTSPTFAKSQILTGGAQCYFPIFRNVYLVVIFLHVTVITVKIKTFFLLFVLKRKKTSFCLNHIYIKFYIKKQMDRISQKSQPESDDQTQKANMVNTVYIHLWVDISC